MTSIVNITRYRGDTKPIKLLTTSDGAVRDISDSEFVLTVSSIADPPDETTKEFEVTGTVTDGPGGAFEFRPTAEQMDLSIGTHYFDVEETDVDGYIDTIAKGKLKIKQDITK